jgi:hypothetical protein
LLAIGEVVSDKIIDLTKLAGGGGFVGEISKIAANITLSDNFS